MGSISCHITPLIINSLGAGTHTHTHTHTRAHTHTHTHTSIQYLQTEAIIRMKYTNYIHKSAYTCT